MYEFVSVAVKVFHQATPGWQAGGSCPSVQCQEAAEAKGRHRPTPKALPGPQPGDHRLLLLEGLQDKERQVPGQVCPWQVPGEQPAGNLHHPGQEGQSTQEEGLSQRVEALHTLNLLPCYTQLEPSLNSTDQIRQSEVKIVCKPCSANSFYTIFVKNLVDKMATH